MGGGYLFYQLQKAKEESVNDILKVALFVEITSFVSILEYFSSISYHNQKCLGFLCSIHFNTMFHNSTCK